MNFYFEIFKDKMKKCDNCEKVADMLCGKCRCLNYCSNECQLEKWKSHKSECFDRSKLKAIILKLERIGLIRHVNGNTMDNRIANLQRVTVKDAFLNKGWTVDAICHLDDAEFKIWENARKLMPSL